MSFTTETPGINYILISMPNFDLQKITAVLPLTPHQMHLHCFKILTLKAKPASRLGRDTNPRIGGAGHVRSNVQGPSQGGLGM